MDRESADGSVARALSDLLNGYLPERVNSGRWLTAYTLFELRTLLKRRRVVLPVCSLGTPVETLVKLAGSDGFLLPPLFHEALTKDLKRRCIDRIRMCFPTFRLEGRDGPATDFSEIEVVELQPVEPPKFAERPPVLAFSVDTAVEEHGPHLPLATDTIQSYSVLQQLAAERSGFVVGPPVEYGQLTWGLPFGMSVDLTPQLTTQYVTGFANSMLDWLQPESLYVVDVHGSIVHRQAIVAGLEASRATRWAFRWLHEPLVEFASERGDQHAGGVETVMIEQAGSELIDRNWFPTRIDEIEAGQMTFQQAVELTPDLRAFFEFVALHRSNGIVGDIRNYSSLNAHAMFGRMLDVARNDVEQLLSGQVTWQRAAGADLGSPDVARD